MTTRSLRARIEKLNGNPGPSQAEARITAALEALRAATGHTDSGEREKWAGRCAAGAATPDDEARLKALPLDAIEAAGLESAHGYVVLLNRIFGAF